jgi:hypothetical protein
MDSEDSEEPWHPSLGHVSAHLPAKQDLRMQTRTLVRMPKKSESTLSLYLSIYTYTHTHKHTYIHTNKHTYIHTYIHTYRGEVRTWQYNRRRRQEVDQMYVAGARGEQLILMLILRCWQALHCLLRALSDPICKRPPFLDPSRRCQCQTSAYVSIRQHTSAYVSFVFGMCVCVERERERGASKKNARGTGSQASHRSNNRNL